MCVCRCVGVSDRTSLSGDMRRSILIRGVLDVLVDTSQIKLCPKNPNLADLISIHSTVDEP